MTEIRIAHMSQFFYGSTSVQSAGENLGKMPSEPLVQAENHQQRRAHSQRAFFFGSADQTRAGM